MYKSEVQERFAQVMQGLRIPCSYYEQDKVFILKKQRIAVIEKRNCVADTHLLKNKKMEIILIDSDSSMTYEDGTESRIIFCKKCEASFFVKNMKRSELRCPECKGDSVRLLANNNRIPGWFGKTEEKYLIDEEEARRHLNAYSGDNADKLEALINTLSNLPKYITVSSAQCEKLQTLKKRYPNMTMVIDYILTAVTASTLKLYQQLTFKPFVLVGGPGCGKTSFVAELCKILMGKPCLKIDLGNDIASFTIVGSDPSYRNSRNGIISEAMVATNDGQPIKNPIIHFDELDKINTGGTYNVLSTFYSILEKSTSARFVDNFLGTAIDASEVNYIFTANTLETVPKPILSRLECFEIQDYTHEQLKEFVIPNFYEKWLSSSSMAREYLPLELDDDIKEKILELCHDDTRRIEVAITKVFEETLTHDSLTGHTIALFSSEQIYNGWRNFRGRKNFDKSIWIPPQGYNWGWKI